MKSWCSVLVAIGLLVSACTSSPEEVAETTATTEAATTTTVEETTTTTTEASTTTTTEALSDEDAVQGAHTAYMTERFVTDERVDGYEPRREAAPQYLTGSVLARTLKFSDEREAAGEFLVSPGYVSNIVEFAIEGDVANVWDCSQDRGELLDADGNVIVGADDFFRIRQTRLERIDGVWLISEFNTGGEECDPDETS